MARFGLEIKIDVKKIDKARLYVGDKGTYLTMTTFIDTEELDAYGNNGFIAHSKNKDETGNTPILGNVKIFWTEQQQPQQNNAVTNEELDALLDDDVPF